MCLRNGRNVGCKTNWCFDEQSAPGDKELETSNSCTPTSTEDAEDQAFKGQISPDILLKQEDAFNTNSNANTSSGACTYR